MEEKFIVAVEIGSSKIKGALAMIEPSGLLNLLAVQEETLVDAVRYGQIKNVEEVSKRIDAIRAKLEASKPVLGRSINGVYVGLSGLSVGSKIADVELNFQVETGITDLTIDELKRRASEAAPAGRDLYAVMPVEFIVDNMSMPNPVGSYGKNIRARFLILSGAPGIKSNINRVFPERLKLDIRGYIVSAAAVADAVLTDDERRLGAVFVDFGAETTTVAIYKEGAMRYLATLPMGSRNITRDLMSLSHLEERAEEIKRVNGVTSTTVDGPRISCAPDIIDQPEINQCIHARACEIIANIMAQIEYAGFRQADLPAGIVIAGGGARMKGFSDLLASRGNIKARPAVAPRDIRLTDASILADDAVDVIALLLHAAKAPQD